jgi:hypothetical protein
MNLPNPLYRFVAVLLVVVLVGGFLWPIIGVSPGKYFAFLIVGALGLAALASAQGTPGAAGGGHGFLCDRCKYNDPRYCSKPDRPNAYTCDEFREQASDPELD